MGVIKDIKKGWEVGRDMKLWRSKNKQGWKDFERTREMLDDELGKGDKEDMSGWTERDLRIHDDTVEKPYREISSKYSDGGLFKEYDKQRGIGLISAMAAESLPRKKKCSCQPKRKPVKKICKKK